MTATGTRHESKPRLLNAALHVFRARGYSAPRIEDTCDSAGLTKGCFFHHTALTGLIVSAWMLVLGLAVGSVVAPVKTAKAASSADQAAGRTAESALAAEEEFARALQNNDADGIARSLSDDWAVISARGGVGEGKSIFPEGIKQGHLTHKAYEISEPRVRLYGNVALVTAKVHNAGTFAGKPFDVMERETDVWLWKDGSWKCVLTHEAWEGAENTQRQLSH